MNINEYESKLNNLYNLLVCKVEEKKNKSNNFDLTEKKIKELENENSNLVKRVEQLENENIIH